MSVPFGPDGEQLAAGDSAGMLYLFRLRNSSIAGSREARPASPGASPGGTFPRPGSDL